MITESLDRCSICQIRTAMIFPKAHDSNKHRRRLSMYSNSCRQYEGSPIRMHRTLLLFSVSTANIHLRRLPAGRLIAKSRLVSCDCRSVFEGIFHESVGSSYCGTKQLVYVFRFCFTILMLLIYFAPRESYHHR